MITFIAWIFLLIFCWPLAIAMERLHKPQREVYSKARFIYQGRNGIAGSYLKRRYNNIKE